jgi:hypothetical protein
LESHRKYSLILSRAGVSDMHERSATTIAQLRAHKFPAGHSRTAEYPTGRLNQAAECVSPYLGCGSVGVAISLQSIVHRSTSSKGIGAGLYRFL